jgi:hypothetical protein
MSGHAEFLASRCINASDKVAARYGTLGAEWTELRLRLRSGGSESDQRQFDMLSDKLRRLNLNLGFKGVADVTESRVVRVGDDREFVAETIAGVTHPLGHLPPEARVIGWIFGHTWFEAAQMWQDSDDGPIGAALSEFSGP